MTKRGRIIAVAIGLLVGVGVAAFALRDNGTQELVPGEVTDPNQTTIASAAGRACVAPVGPLPAGAPDVPVPIGIPPTALERRELFPGTGAPVTEDATVTVEYIGVACSTGAVFDSSYANGAPVTFALANVIPGWRDGLTGVTVGSRVLLGVPPELAYGESGFPPSIGPGETLWFVVDVLDASA